MFHTILGVFTVFCAVGALGIGVTAVKRDGGMLDKVYQRLLNAFCCFMLGTILGAIISGFVLILGG